MSTNLNSQGVIPKHQPFNLLPWSYTGSEEVITVPENVVDWVLVELRTGTEKGSAESWRAGFLKNNGLVVDLDGTSDLGFENLTGNKYYVVIYHRNHVSVMSSGLVTLE
jgi:hypothetical protein